MIKIGTVFTIHSKFEKNVSHHQSMLNPVVFIGLAITSLCYFVAGEIPAKAFLAGYMLFSLDVMIMAYIGHLVVKVITSRSKADKKIKNTIMFLGLIKLLFVFGALYYFICEVNYPPSFLFIGCLISLVWTIAILSYEYSKHLKKTIPNIPCYQI